VLDKSLEERRVRIAVEREKWRRETQAGRRRRSSLVRA
jgi:hypothetical protein